MNIINIGILAHVDAGKTTLTESLLYASGAISEPGSVEKGTTRTDTLFLERQRGITIQAAVTITLMCGIFWEYVAPFFLHQGVSDVYDVIAYVLGGITYLLL